MSLFQASVLNKFLSSQDESIIKKAYQDFEGYFLNDEIQKNIRNSKEEQFQEGFLRELFVKILGYTISPEPNYNLTTELKNVRNSKKTDGAILKDGKALAVLELKSTNTKDLNKVTEQAFNYKNNQPGCDYVVTSNFERLRFYIHNAVEFEEFNLFNLSYEDFRLLWILLQKDNLLGVIPQRIKEESVHEEEKVTKNLYRDYSLFKNDLWKDLCLNNPHLDELVLYKQSQRILDRFLFIFFTEDKGILPPNVTTIIVDQWNKLKELDEYQTLYSRFVKFFGYLNSGYSGANYTIPAFNGGLFKPDPVLNGLKLSDAVLEKHVLKMTDYDFDTEVDTNILGHIFEHSLNDIENVRAQLAGEEVDKSKTKRKKDGVFYTPKYITKYIVDNTVGKLCEEKKAEIGIDEEEFAKDRKGRKTATLKKLDAQLKEYREWLLQLTICDPACGSGAFLNQALEFLMAEHRYVDELESQLLGYAMVFPDVENHILERNIFGVDINEESVEIARLSLWLRTAKKGRKLTSLSSNIKVGNSLIDDPEVAGELAFNWQEQFPRVFEKNGFDVVIGNPPYGATISNADAKFLRDSYETATYQVDTYPLFAEFASRILAESGKMSYIIPTAWVSSTFGVEMRRLLIEKVDLQEIVVTNKKTFADATVETLILSFDKSSPTDEFIVKRWDIDSAPFNVSVRDIKTDDQYSFPIYSDPLKFGLVRSVQNGSDKFSTYLDFVWGVKVYQKGKGIPKQTGVESKDKTFHLNHATEAHHLSLIGGKDISRYHLNPSSQFLDYGVWLAEPRTEDWFDTVNSRLLIREVTSNGVIQATLTNYPSVFTNSVDGARLNDASSDLNIEFFLGVLNSRLISFYHLNSSANSFKDAFPKLLVGDLRTLPIPEVDKSSILYERITKSVKKISNELVQLRKLVSDFSDLLVVKFELPLIGRKLEDWPALDFKSFLVELKKKKVKLSLEEEAEWLTYFNKKKTEANALQAEIERIDKEIDQMVYVLYGLTDEEIAIVEQA